MTSASGADRPQPAGDVWPVGRVASELGIPAITLRMWERRYGIGPSLRTSGRHRRYTAQEVERLRRMVELIRNGTSAADAARVSHQSRSRVSVEELLDRVTSYELAPATDALERLLGEVGAAPAWHDIITPAFQRLDEQFAEAANCADLELMLASVVSEAAHRHTARLVVPGRPVLLLPCPGEQHTLPLVMLRTVLLERGCPAVAVEGGSNDLSLLAAAERTDPVVVVLWSMARRAGQSALKRQFEQQGRRTLTAGPGWPAPARDLSDLDGAAAVLAAEF